MTNGPSMFTRRLRRDLLNASAAKLSSNDVVVFQSTGNATSALPSGRKCRESMLPRRHDRSRLSLPSSQGVNGCEKARKKWRRGFD
ncbi:MAG: hypothetical protein EOR22_32230 [Mesorhizobium sp.]|nr:MAG: hypothetical protein EOR22_32230 [Mesorhizobium sp.]